MNIISGQIFEMENLVSRSGKFTIAQFQEALMETAQKFKDYIANNGENNNLQPITLVYLVQSKQNNRVITDIYIGISPNIL